MFTQQIKVIQLISESPLTVRNESLFNSDIVIKQ